MSSCEIIVHTVGALLCISVVAVTVAIIVDAIGTARRELRR
jgi:hypothetical protein